MANLEVLALDEATPQIRAPGSGDGYAMPRPVTISAGTFTTDVQALNLSFTWNNAAVTFEGAKIYATDTASAAASRVVDFGVGSASLFGLRRFELSGTKYDRSVIELTQYAYILNASAGGLFGFGSTTAAIGTVINGNHVGVTSTGSFNFTSDTTNATTLTFDTRLYRDAAATIAQRNSTNAQTLRLYRTYTDASNYQRLTETWSTSTAVIHNEGAGTGADGSIAFNDAALATDATKGFIMIPSCAGTPTGIPADIPTGQVPIVFDSTNNKLYVYDGGWLATAALT